MEELSLSKKLKEKGVKNVLVSFYGINGLTRGKLVPVEYVDDVLQSGVTFTGHAAGDLGFSKEDPDFTAIPDPSSLIIMPWQKDSAWMVSRIFLNGKLWPKSPRDAAIKFLSSIKESRNLTVKLGVETEFFLVEENQGKIMPADTKDRLEKPCYDGQAIFRDKIFNILRKIEDAFKELDWGAYAIDHEDANGQFEIDWSFDDSLITADRFVFVRFMIRKIAEREGVTATFMPKPFTNLTGNGAHFNLSVWREDKNLFYDSSKENGISDFQRYFVGGILYHAKALVAILASTVNSYKRLFATSTLSGFPWVSTYATYSVDTKTSMVRIPIVKNPTNARIELRTPDGLVNPYLAIPAIVAAGLDGVDRKIDPGEPNDKEINKDKMLPTNLKEAIEELLEDNVIRRALGDELVELFTELKLNEWFEYNRIVTDWEIMKYLNWG